MELEEIQGLLKHALDLYFDRKSSFYQDEKWYRYIVSDLNKRIGFNRKVKKHKSNIIT